MRIISGTARGTKLFTLDGVQTRPTLDRVKESLFSILQTKIPDAIVLDLFSGSGALGLESISRGATKAVLCDNSYQAIRIIKQNVEKTKTKQHVEILHLDYKKAIEKLKEEQQKFNIVFLDPPYKKNLLVDAILRIQEANLLESDGIFIAETDENEVIEEIKNLNNIYDYRNYGRVTLIFGRSN